MSRRLRPIFAFGLFVLSIIPIWGMMTASANIETYQPNPPQRTPRATQEGGRTAPNQPAITPQAPVSSPEISVTRDFSSYFDNLTAITPQTTLQAYPTISLTMPTEMPAWEDLDFSELQLTVTWENPPTTSSEAYSALVGFDNSYLGSGQSPTYASMVSSTDGSSEAYASIVAQLPAEVQSYLAIVSDSDSVTYWGTYPSGLGILVVADCNSTQCTQSYESLQLQIAQASMGVYGVYKNAVPTTDQEALSMIVSAYPLLGSATFYPTETDTGYAFSAVSDSISRDTATIVGYYAGVVPTGTSSLVYVVVGIGDGTVAVMYP